MSSTEFHFTLPKQFISSMKVLFDILDKYKQDFILLKDIESRWQGSDVEGLPPGVVDNLRKVARSDGTLDFDRFIAGIKNTLLDSTHNNGGKRTKSPSRNYNAVDRHEQIRNVDPHPPDLITHGRSNSASPSRHNSQSSTHHQQNGGSGNNFDARGKTNFDQFYASNGSKLSTLQQRTFSMPVLSDPDNNMNLSVQHMKNRSFSPENQRRGGENDEATQKWRQNKIEQPPPLVNNRWADDPRASVASMSALDRYGGRGLSPRPGPEDTSVDDLGLGAARWRTGRPTPTRRHTVTNGVDYQMIKRMKQLEQEKDALIQGLETVDRARDWYQEQIRQLQDKQRHLGAAGQQDYSLDAHQERINFLIGRVNEVNQQLNTLMDSARKGFPLHMNLAIRTPVASPAKTVDVRQIQEQNNTISKLKSHVRQLTQDVGQKSEKIGQLEHEKAQLIREMFQASSKNRNHNYEDTSYI